ncbi:hypothetical protein OE766_18995 [Pararhizobium sp. YC-54]|uniref:hypothetical protein n=1 Tax=Pararhizobium sp. YC-54 TaxID=2986920 RepID=UPI0021F79B8C|nr:hypothetical protein [Pararhizobium sp. YC-54]MCW0000321.1 hypothetical protein [Pararhizobium sp. YC-54]
MLKIFSILDLLLPAPVDDDTDASWSCDLLRHPDIARMDTRELGDLPFPGKAVRLAPKQSGEACPA